MRSWLIIGAVCTTGAVDVNVVCSCNGCASCGEASSGSGKTPGTADGIVITFVVPTLLGCGGNVQRFCTGAIGCTLAGALCELAGVANKSAPPRGAVSTPIGSAAAGCETGGGCVT